MQTNQITFSSLKDSSYIWISINQKKVRALIDTGAGITCISKKMADKLNLKLKSFQPGKIKSFYSASGSSLNAVGIAKINYNLNGLIISFDTVVLDNLTGACIIGSDFLNATSARIDFSTGTVSFEDDLVTLPVTATHTKQDYIRVLARTVLQPNTESIIPVKVAKHFSNVVSLIEPKSVIEEADYFVAKCLVKPQGIKTVVQILNIANEPVILEKNQRIGLITRLSRGDEVIEINKNQTIASIQPESKKQVSDSQPINRQKQRLTKEEQESFVNDYKFDINPDLTPEQRDRLISLLYEYRSVFARSFSEIGCFNKYEVNIETVPHKPIFTRQYRLSAEQVEAAQSEINEMVKCNILEPAVKSKYNQSYLMIRKADKSYRLVIDMRKLNSFTKTWSFNCKSIPEIIEKISTSQSNYFTTCDL